MIVYEINTKDEKDVFYKIFLVFEPVFNIRRSALRILSHLAYFNWKYRNVPKKQRDKLMFSYEAKMEIANEMNLRMQDINNQLTFLRKNGFINKQSLGKEYRIDPDKYSEITFKFNKEWQQ